MTGLSVLYANEAVDDREWATISERDRTGRLREVYWMRRGESKISAKSFVNVTMYWRPDRSAIGRKRDDPGDGFTYLADMTQTGGRFEWLEVTEVFTTVPASQIEEAMRAWNGIPTRTPVDLVEFRKNLPRGRPTKSDQRRAADRVIAQVERKLSKRSYNELLEKYGYGTLVVGLPLWFAVPPDNPFRSENALDNFYARTMLGLEEIKRNMLRRRNCPFRNVFVLWDTTPQAMRTWLEKRSVENYGYVANANLEDLLDVLDKMSSKTEISEGDMPSMGLHIIVKTRKNASGKEPRSRMVEALQDLFGDHDEKRRMSQLRIRLRWGDISGPLELFRFIKFRGLKNLKQWVVHKISISRAWNERMTRRRARLFDRESRRRIRASHIRSP